MDAMFSIVPVLIALGFGWIIFTWIRNARYNNSQPRLQVNALVTGKRTQVSHSHHDNHVHNSTLYYATFEFSTGDRKEFLVNGSEYGLLREDDKGMLTFQGNRFIAFDRV